MLWISQWMACQTLTRIRNCTPNVNHSLFSNSLKSIFHSVWHLERKNLTMPLWMKILYLHIKARLTQCVQPGFSEGWPCAGYGNGNAVKENKSLINVLLNWTKKWKWNLDYVLIFPCSFLFSRLSALEGEGKKASVEIPPNGIINNSKWLGWIMQYLA